ncbi:MAG: response regulator [Planctomycetota bacterium]
MPDGTILVVDDEAAVREVLRETLEFEGYSTADASNGREALEWLKNNPPPCLVLLDLMMPVMNGFDFLEAVQKDPALRSVSILIVSATTREKLEETARRTGAVGVLSKPLQLAALLEAVAQHC